MAIDFDPVKDARNVAERGISFAMAEDFAWATASIEPDRRRDYGEDRFVATGFIGARLHVLVFTLRGADIRVISTGESRRTMPKRPDPYLIDDENPELTSEQIRSMRPASEVLPPKLYAKLVADYEARQAGKKESVLLNLDADVAAKLRATGPDWADNASAILRKAVGL